MIDGSDHVSGIRQGRRSIVVSAEPGGPPVRDDNERTSGSNNLAILDAQDHPVFDLYFLRLGCAWIPESSCKAWSCTLGRYIKELNTSRFGHRGHDAKHRRKHAESKHDCPQ